MHVHVDCGDGEAKFGWSLKSRWPRIIAVVETDQRDRKDHKGKYDDLERAWQRQSPVEVTHISSHGWFMSYNDFPWFKDLPVRKILNVQEPTPEHFLLV